ncbi:MAG: hypothetical protein V3W44_05420, partial [Dehalococcoidales bacterium]
MFGEQEIGQVRVVVDGWLTGQIRAIGCAIAVVLGSVPGEGYAVNHSVVHIDYGTCGDAPIRTGSRAFEYVACAVVWSSLAEVHTNHGAYSQGVSIRRDRQQTGDGKRQ